MAQWIDKAALWIFASVSALMLMLILTDGHIAFSVSAAFILIAALRHLIARLPDAQWLSRSERIRRSKAMIRRWTLMNEKDALSEIRRILPAIIDEESWKNVRLIQLLPDSGNLNCNQLLDIWRVCQPAKKLTLIATCAAEKNAFSLTEELREPEILLIDSNTLIRPLVRIVHQFPEMHAKKERRASLSEHVAHLTQNIRPIRTGVYAAVSMIVYLITRSPFHLAASVLFSFLLLLFFFRKRYSIS